MRLISSYTFCDWFNRWPNSYFDQLAGSSHGVNVTKNIQFKTILGAFFHWDFSKSTQFLSNNKKL